MGDHSGNYTLEFEKPVRELENQIQDLRDVSGKPHLDLSTEVGALQRKVDKLITEILSGSFCNTVSNNAIT